MLFMSGPQPCGFKQASGHYGKGQGNLAFFVYLADLTTAG